MTARCALYMNALKISAVPDYAHGYFSRNFQWAFVPIDPVNVLENGEKGAWAYPGTAHFFTPYYLRNGLSYRLQIWPVHSQVHRPSKPQPIKNFGGKGAWAYPDTAQFSGVPPIISGTGKATNFQCCTHIYRLNRNKSPLKISRKVAVGVVSAPENFQGTHI